MEEMLPPESVRGLRVLEEAAFKKTVSVNGLVVPKRQCQEVVKALRKASQTLRINGIAPVRNIPENESSMLVLLAPNVDENAFPGNISQLLASGTLTRSSLSIDLEFANYTASQVFSSVLPDNVPSVSSFATIGHVAHLNLKREHEPFRQIIGQVILAKNPVIRTVVNKTQAIDNTYRTFAMELLAGEPETVVTHSENGCTYKFDFAKVFWNSRLCGEHLRIVEMLTKDDVVCDVFAGVGPFVIPAAKQGCRVYANDLNTYSTDSLSENCKLNRVSTSVSVFNLDGREFMREIVRMVTSHRGGSANGNDSTTWPMFNHVVMNLPAIAIEFLDVFRGLFAGSSDLAMPMVHCYCFSSADDPKQDVISRVKKVLHVDDLGEDVHVHEVRSIAISAHQYCISFRLPTEVAYTTSADEEAGEPPAKRAFTDS